MDWGSIVGLLLALGGVFIGQALEGGKLESLFQPAAFMIVVFGTCGAVVLQSGIGRFVRAIKMAKQAFVQAEDHSAAVMSDITLWSNTARREGLLALERFLDAVRDPFMSKALRLIIDGADPVKLRDLLENDISAYEMEEKLAAKVWDAAGGYSPTVGILGAVLGLIHVMENLSDPSRLGSGIAVAFVATIYGVGLANLVFLPIGSKLKTIVGKEVMRRERLVDAFVGIASGENPRMIEERIAVYLK